MTGWPDVALEVIDGWPIWIKAGATFCLLGIFYFALFNAGSFLRRLLSGQIRFRGKERSGTYTGQERRKSGEIVEDRRK